MFPRSGLCLLVESLTVGLLPVFSLSGCLPSDVSGKVGEVAEAHQEPDPQTPEELLERLQTIKQEVDERARALGPSNATVGARQLQTQTDVGLETADRLLSHADLSAEHIRAARYAKARLLYHGLKRGRDGFSDRLIEVHQQLASECPQSPETANVEAMILEQVCLDEKLEFNEVMSALQAHVTRFPNQPTGLPLYCTYAESLRKRRLSPELKRCCQVGVSLYGDQPQAAPLREELARIAETERVSRARQAHLAEIRALLGGRSEGYFVVYAHPKVVKYMTPVEYEVLHGLRSTAAYVDGLKEDWVWELMRSFPDTRDGGKRASEFCADLIKKNTITIPTFGSPR